MRAKPLASPRLRKNYAKKQNFGTKRKKSETEYLLLPLVYEKIKFRDEKKKIRDEIPDWPGLLPALP
jgi:hypothetical protein